MDCSVLVALTYLFRINTYMLWYWHLWKPEDNLEELISIVWVSWSQPRSWSLAESIAVHQMFSVPPAKVSLLKKVNNKSVCLLHPTFKTSSTIFIVLHKPFFEDLIDVSEEKNFNRVQARTALGLDGTKDFKSVFQSVTKSFFSCSPQCIKLKLYLPVIKNNASG